VRSACLDCESIELEIEFVLSKHKLQHTVECLQLVQSASDHAASSTEEILRLYPNLLQSESKSLTYDDNSRLFTERRRENLSATLVNERSI
jgi:hypothetical protein